MPRPVVTYALIAGMLIISLPTIAFPELNGIFGGVGRLRYPWQVFSAAFMHGWPGFPLMVHLGLNLVLIGLVGPMAEKLLGAARFLGLTLFAILAYWMARKLTSIEANGSSVFIWAYAPILFVGLRLTDRASGGHDPSAERAKAMLVVMWGIVPITMVGILVANGIAPWIALVFGNVFHISGTVVGIVGALAWRDHVAARLRKSGHVGSGIDVSAAIASFAIPAFLLTILILTSIGRIGR